MNANVTTSSLIYDYFINEHIYINQVQSKHIFSSLMKMAQTIVRCKTDT